MRITIIDDMISRLEQFEENLPKGHTVRTPLDLEIAEVTKGCIENTLMCGEVLLEEGCDVLYLDHDFGPDTLQGAYGGVTSGTGMDLLQGIIKNLLPCPTCAIIVHSANVPAAIQMVAKAQVLDIPVVKMWAPWAVKGCKLTSVINEDNNDNMGTT
jgi:hypothetical protein